MIEITILIVALTLGCGQGMGNCQPEERIKNLRLGGVAVVRERGSPVKMLSSFIVAQRHRKGEEPEWLQIVFANERKGGKDALSSSAAQRQSLGHH